MTSTDARGRQVEASVTCDDVLSDDGTHLRAWTNDAEGRIGVPVAFVAATYDVLAGARDMRSAADRLADATYTELRGSHFIQMEQPEVVHGLLRDFLVRVG